MSPFETDPPPAPDADGDRRRRAEELELLRGLLVGGERARIERLEQRKIDAEAVGEALPDAVLLRSARDDRLAAALAPTVERGLESSARKNPKVLADAIYPILGPAIRKSIQAALQGVVENINLAIENSLSPKSFRWRLEARRAGVPYGEYLLTKSLLYRIEQVFLIHRETGLLLQQAALPDARTKDPDLVSGMMSAVTAFVGDSFGAEEGEGLELVEVGDTRLAVAHGPRAVLAAVVRGNPPGDLQVHMEEALERVHLERAETLQDFDGDATPFASFAPDLEVLLGEQQRPRRRSGSGTGFLLPAVLLVVVFFGVRRVLAWSNARRTWHTAVERIDAEPGYVVVEASRSGHAVRGLRDPLARPLDQVLTGLELPPVAWTWEAYQAGEGALVARRARHVLAPPAGVELDVREDGVLTARGRAPGAWIRDFTTLWPALPGIAGVDRSGLVDLDVERLRDLETRAQGREVPWAGPQSDADPLVRSALDLVAELDAAARAAGVDGIVLEVRGLREDGESPELAEARAATFVARALDARPTRVELRARPAVDAGTRTGVRLELLDDGGPR